MAKKLGADVRSTIRATAADLFIQNGIHATSLNDIARDAELSKGTIYYYYPSKEALVNELAHDCTEKTSDVIYTWLEGLSRGDDVHASLTALLGALTADEGNAHLHTVLCMEVALHNAELQSLLELCYKEWTLMVEVGALKMQTKASALLKDRSRLFFTLLDGYLLLSQGCITEISKEDIVKLILS